MARVNIEIKVKISSYSGASEAAMYDHGKDLEQRIAYAIKRVVSEDKFIYTDWEEQHGPSSLAPTYFLSSKMEE